MTTILETIIAYKKVEVEQQKKEFPLEKLLKQTRLRKRYSLKENLLKSDASGVIAEFKRKSPSKNWINQQAVSTEIVPGYEKAGSSGSSILTDLNFFGGTQSDLIEAGKLVELPILRKDFIIDEYQIIETNKIGADVILLIAACLTPERVAELTKTALQNNVEVLLEIHNEQELGHICDGVTMVGVNNRNLHTFTTSLETSVMLSKQIPDNFIKISESGINSASDINYLKKHGFKGFLIGEWFMKTANPVETCKTFIKSL